METFLRMNLGAESAADVQQGRVGVAEPPHIDVDEADSRRGAQQEQAQQE
jgi:hypothetical protein